MLGEIQEIPIFYNDPNIFWAEEVHLKNLLPLEIINLSLSNSQEIVFFRRQADSLGNLWLNLASFSDLLSPNSVWYALDYLRLGGETHCLMGITPLSLAGLGLIKQFIYLDYHLKDVTPYHAGIYYYLKSRL